jgi:hypothetical protein
MQVTIDLDFSDLEPYVLPFEVEGKKYELREPTSNARRKYNNERMNRVLYENGAVSGMRDIADLEPMLVSLCCFDVDTNKPVPETVIGNWSGRMVKRLFEAAKTISLINDESNTDLSLLLKALSTTSNRPCSREDFVDWVNTLGNEYQRLKSVVAKEVLDPKKE